jgi:hypothetical protein
MTKGRKLVKIYARMLNPDLEIASFDDFEDLFGSMRPIWREILPVFFFDLDQLRGDWMDDLIKSEFWRDVRFLGVDSILQKFDALKQWELMSYLPQYEVASLFADSVKEGRPKVSVLVQDDLPIDAQDVAPLVFEVLVGLEGRDLQRAAEEVRRWMAPFAELVAELAEKFGEAGGRVAAALQ